MCGTSKQNLKDTLLKYSLGKNPGRHSPTGINAALMRCAGVSLQLQALQAAGTPEPPEQGCYLEILNILYCSKHKQKKS
jgi:hypothetical protein